MDKSTVCVFGDSITWGSHDPKRGGWATQLRNYFESEEEYVKVYPLGITGNTSGDILERFDVEAASRQPTMVIFAIGTNDSQYINSKDTPRVPLPKFKENLLALTEKAKKYTPAIIFVGLTGVDESRTMPVSWSTTKYYDNDNLSKYNAVIQEIAAKNGFQFIDVSGILKNDELKDGLHPNSVGHKKLFKKIRGDLSL